MQTQTVSEMLDRIYYELVLTAPTASAAIVALNHLAADVEDMCDTLAVSGLDTATAAIARANQAPDPNQPGVGGPADEHAHGPQCPPDWWTGVIKARQPGHRST